MTEENGKLMLSTGQKRITLEMWIHEATVDTEKDGAINAFVLVHMRGEREDQVHQFRFSKAGQADPKSLAKMFRSKAEAYCQDFPGMNTFCLLAFYVGSDEPQAKHPFRVNVPYDYGGLGMEAATEMGQRQATMRREEMTHHQMFAKQTHLDGMQIRMIDRLDTMLTKSQEREERLFDMTRNLLVQMSQQNHQAEMERIKLYRDTQREEKLLKMAPALINSITGTETFPQATEDTALIEAAAEHITPQHMLMLEAVLPQEVIGALADRFKRYTEKKTAEIQQASTLPKFSGSAEDDITGGATKP